MILRSQRRLWENREIARFNLGRSAMVFRREPEFETYQSEDCFVLTCK